MISFGRTFFKLSGSGNDFVAFDELGVRSGEDPAWLTPAAIRALCRRGEGVGADGVMVLRSHPGAAYQLLYYNADGTRAELCGNASLCSVRLALELGVIPGDESIRFVTDTGLMAGRLADGTPEIDLLPATEVQPDRADLGAGGGDEQRMGFARLGVPHLVVLCDDAEVVDVAARGARLRRHPALRDGANVNYVSATDGGWRIRTFERGVEAETLACGTGSVASALLLQAWQQPAAPGGEALPAGRPDGSANEPSGVRLLTSSGRWHRVRLHRTAAGVVQPSLGGSARVVYRGELGEGDW